jgi:Fe-S oxidoreductase
MPSSTLVLWVLVLCALGISAWRFFWLLRPMLHARPAARFDRPSERLLGVLRAVGLHERLLKVRYSGILHALIFSGFLVLFTAIVQAVGSGLIPGFTLAPIGGQTWIAFLQDVFGLGIIVALGMAAWQRYVVKPPRFKGSNEVDGGEIAGGWRPVSGALAGLLASLGLTPAGASIGAGVAYWLHIAVILVFLIYIPGSKHRHMFLAAPNIYWRSLEPKGLLPGPAPDEPPQPIAAVADLTWKDMFDGFACTECGRCQAACPAYAAGLPLSPKLLITGLRDYVIATSNGETEAPLAGGAISEATLWACTTCRACMEVCPVHIEHVPKIVGMRRSLVEQGRIQPLVQDALSNLQRTGNSMGKPARMRARWTKDLPFKVKDARSEPVDVLWFVGDFASYDPRVQQITRRVAELLHAADVDFGILYEDEQNSGNDVHRVGEEGLFETLARHNVEALSGCQFNRIVTTDPHSLNALRQEYPPFGAEYDVVHYSQLLSELVAAGRLPLHTAAVKGAVTYHDPCYLGRYNGGFDAPRQLIEQAGYRLHEMGRCRENSFCCGAGGGRIWSDDTGVTERPSENRIKEALALGDAHYFVVACPKDFVMYTAAVQSLGVEDRIVVRDIAELINIEPSTDSQRKVPQ